MKLTETEKKEGYIIAVRKEPGKAAETIKLLNTYNGIKNVINGLIETRPAPYDFDNIDIIYNIDELRQNPNAKRNIIYNIGNISIYGIILMVGLTESQTWRGLTDAEAAKACEYLNAAAAERC